MTTSADRRIDALLDDPALERVWDAARRRLERGGLRVEGVAFQLRDLALDERARLALVLGRDVRGSGVRVRLEDLDRALRRAGCPDGLCAALERRGGVLTDRPGTRVRRAAEVDRFWRDVGGHVALQGHPALASWLDRLRAGGWWMRAAGPEERTRITRALDVLAELPAVGDRSRLASDVCGDPHALDDDAPLGRLVVAALAVLADRPPPNRAAARRALWRAFGVEVDPLASTVLVFGLHPLARGPVTDAVGRLAAAGMPLHVSLEMLRAESWELRAPRVFACENPSVLRAAARAHGDRCAPLVCTEGMPSAACRRLFAIAREGGAEIAYHGDFGAGGVRIGNVVIGTEGARAWRFGAADYVRAIAAGVTGTPIRGDVTAAVWDPDLAAALREHGLEIHEESTIDDLLPDLHLDSRLDPAAWTRGPAGRLSPTS